MKTATYSSLALSSETLLRLEPFRGLQATNSTSNISVALHQIVLVILRLIQNINCME